MQHKQGTGLEIKIPQVIMGFEKSDVKHLCVPFPQLCSPWVQLDWWFIGWKQIRNLRVVLAGVMLWKRISKIFCCKHKIKVVETFGPNVQMVYCIVFKSENSVIKQIWFHIPAQLLIIYAPGAVWLMFLSLSFLIFKVKIIAVASSLSVRVKCFMEWEMLLIAPGDLGVCSLQRLFHL